MLAGSALFQNGTDLNVESANEMAKRLILFLEMGSRALISFENMKAIEGYRLITPDELTWRPSNLMRVPNADYLERTGSELLGARLWRLPPKSANTLQKHVRAEEFYFVVEGIGRIRVGDAVEVLELNPSGGAGPPSPGAAPGPGR